MLAPWIKINFSTVTSRFLPKSNHYSWGQDANVGITKKQLMVLICNSKVAQNPQCGKAIRAVLKWSVVCHWCSPTFILKNVNFYSSPSYFSAAHRLHRNLLYHLIDVYFTNTSQSLMDGHMHAGGRVWPFSFTVGIKWNQASTHCWFTINLNVETHHEDSETCLIWFIRQIGLSRLLIWKPFNHLHWYEVHKLFNNC